MPCAFHLHPARACQFVVPESDLIEFDGQHWCVLHLPMSTEETQSPKSQWNEARINAFNESIFALMGQTKPDQYCPLYGVVFPGEVSFERYAGENNGLPKVSFESADFFGPASFRECKFIERALFDRATFRDAAIFTKATFEDASFQEATFCGGASFNLITVAKSANYVRARFERNVEFTRAVLGGIGWFLYATFGGEAGFRGTEFGSYAAFQLARFVGLATFDGAVFSGSADFIGVTFDQDARFAGYATSEGCARNADTFARSSFRDATFGRRANFIDRRFLGPTDFRNASFHVAPEFHNSVLHQSTDFSGTRFLDRVGTKDVNAAMAYRTLKLAMEHVRARDEEARFYGYEQQSLRAKKDTPCSIKAVSWLYEITSDYGQSFALPLSWIFVIFFGFTLCYAFIGGAETWGNWQGVVWFAAQQVFQPFGAFRTFVGASAAGSVSLGFALLAACHSLITLTSLALFLLALRRRFRLN